MARTRKPSPPTSTSSRSRSVVPTVVRARPSDVVEVKRSRPASALTLYPKTTATGATGALTVILVYCLHQYANVDLPPEVASAVTLILSTVAAWFAPPTKS